MNRTHELIKAWQQGSSDYRANNSDLYKKLRKTKIKELDKAFHEQHEQVFQSMDCLECANCCKTTSPIFYQADIDRLARTLKMKVPEFIDTYLRVDEDNDYVLKSSPCPFLGHDNKCIVYASRPTACREYPHTDRKRMNQVLNLTFNNAEICPAVYGILERLKEVKA
ncbi:YkgJ family cysteine cluster protein [Marivirga atlantica]|uniref:YkgJ family cysteine cluster protein n=1 Tax=Marivirga atlantica TaxID=1548457 RepID=A0A937ABB6_9BACT|nr:YkgJ family cysteine cluster protein [Marivirga atlantica]MBL0765776.1 YkgJ family cysteine cluster protein [Marivirga atlantica]